MSDEFHKFPHTPHLLWLGEGSPRDDKILNRAEAVEFLSAQVIVEEKVDGANLGFSLGSDGRVRAQSRGRFLTPGRSHAQWEPLWAWLAERRVELEEGLRAGLLLYGEWCFARHTIPYDALPDWFLGFDILEIESGRFWSADRRNAWFQGRGLASVPEIKRGRLELKRLLSLIGDSALGNVPMEGVYFRREHNGLLQARAKMVNAAFRQQREERWSRRSVVPNQLVVVHV
jgi:ATP-dependent RNA circularization protein (DNA/RNA ligase family)